MWSSGLGFSRFSGIICQRSRSGYRRPGLWAGKIWIFCRDWWCCSWCFSWMSPKCFVPISVRRFRIWKNKVTLCKYPVTVAQRRQRGRVLGNMIIYFSLFLCYTVGLIKNSNDLKITALGWESVSIFYYTMTRSNIQAAHPELRRYTKPSKLECCLP